jgi:hypothetical protein
MQISVRMSPQTLLPDSNASLGASMDDFEAREFSPTIPDLPSQHSGFRSNNNSEYSESSSRRSYSPPAWRKAGSGWFKHQQSASPSRMGFNSASPAWMGPGDETEDGEMTAYRTARRIPLPESPTKGRTPSSSPEVMMTAQPVAREISPREPSREPSIHTPRRTPSETRISEPESPSAKTPTQNNCECWDMPTL